MLELEVIIFPLNWMVNYYNVEETAEPYIYSIELKNYSKKGKFSIDILDGGSVLASGQQFEIEKKGMSQNNMFDF